MYKYIHFIVCLLLLPGFAFSASELKLEEAQKIADQVLKAAKTLNKNVTVAVVGAQGETILIYRGDGVGPHNTEAARRKAYTALSTKTPTLTLARNARSNPDTANLAELPELLLLGGGTPLFKEGSVIGAVGVAGGGGPENDDLLATKGSLPKAGISTGK